MSVSGEYISAFETERIVENLKVFTLEQFGTVKWLDQHESMERLTIQV
jgi:hypothetical protein